MEAALRQEQEEKVSCGRGGGGGGRLDSGLKGPTLHNQNLILTLLQKALVADVAATRELCVQLDKTKDSLSRQLASQSISYEQVGNHC